MKWVYTKEDYYSNIEEEGANVMFLLLMVKTTCPLYQIPILREAIRIKKE